VDDGHNNIEDITTAIMRSGAEWAVIDGLKDVFTNRGENETARENYISSRLVKTARDCNIATITVSHLHKLDESAWIYKQNIRGTGNQSTSGRMVLLLQDAGFPAGLTEQYGDMEGNIILQAAKASYGETGWIVLRPELEHGRFVEVEKDENNP